ncbi:MAG: DUF2207 domain-containing protein, partial [Candidatus Doudnabacteria bacterium]|nr:DUF2207 domain-containing protein [Candidatus Doudnabacteria bacterium]
MNLKKLFTQLSLTFIALVFFAGFFNVVRAQESIKSFDVSIKVSKEGVVSFQEKIIYDFGPGLRHGIFRDIPVKYSRNGGSYNLRLNNISVTDQNGQPYEFSVSTSGGKKHIKIGDPEVTVTGEQVYVINYETNKAINFLDERDELYWNVTGNEWQVPILKTSATFVLSNDTNADSVEKFCFSGVLGSQNHCDEVLIEPGGSMGGQIKFSHGLLSAGE